MAVDYDEPRHPPTEPDESLEAIQQRRTETRSPSVDVDETNDVYDLPGAEVLDEELTGRVVPMQADEFRCSRCFLIHHRGMLAGDDGDAPVCRECA